MVYNAVECCNTAAVYSEMLKALPFGRALFVIPEGELIMAVSYKKLWKLLIDKDIKKKDLSAIYRKLYKRNIKNQNELLW